MTGITGSNKVIGVGITDTWSEARELGANEGIDSVSNFDISANNDTLQSAPIGSGNDMQGDAETGATSPTVSIDFDAKYDGFFPKALSLMMGHSAVPMTMGAGVYTHSIIYNATKPASYACIAEKRLTDEVFEMPSALPTNISLTIDSLPGYMQGSCEFLGDTVNPGDSAVNTSATIDNVTVPSSYIITPQQSDKFLINAQGGAALSDSDKINISSITMGFQMNREHAPEIKNSSGNGIPRLSGEYPFQPTLTITLRSVEDLTWFEAWRDGTEYKAEFVVTGPQVGSTGVYRTLDVYYPRLKVVEWPDASISEAGENPATITFVCLKASSAPTGFLDDMPYILLTNTTSTNPLATTSV